MITVFKMFFYQSKNFRILKLFSTNNQKGTRKQSHLLSFSSTATLTLACAHAHTLNIIDDICRCGCFFSFTHKHTLDTFFGNSIFGKVNVHQNDENALFVAILKVVLFSQAFVFFANKSVLFIYCIRVYIAKTQIAAENNKQNITPKSAHKILNFLIQS